MTDTLLNITGNNLTVVSQTYPGTIPPTVSMTSPANGANVSGTVQLQASASAVSPATVTQVQFLLDGQPLGSPVTSSPYTYSWKVGSTSLGNHTLSAQVTDSDGDVSTAPADHGQRGGEQPVHGRRRHHRADRQHHQPERQPDRVWHVARRGERLGQLRRGVRAVLPRREGAGEPGYRFAVRGELGHHERHQRDPRADRTGHRPERQRGHVLERQRDGPEPTAGDDLLRDAGRRERPRQEHGDDAVLPHRDGR